MAELFASNMSRTSIQIHLVARLGPWKGYAYVCQLWFASLRSLLLNCWIILSCMWGYIFIKGIVALFHPNDTTLLPYSVIYGSTIPFHPCVSCLLLSLLLTLSPSNAICHQHSTMKFSAPPLPFLPLFDCYTKQLPSPLYCTNHQLSCSCHRHSISISINTLYHAMCHCCCPLL